MMTGRQNLSARMVEWAGSHVGATCVLAALAVVALVALLVWFEVFSGLSGPVQYVYGGF